MKMLIVILIACFILGSIFSKYGDDDLASLFCSGFLICIFVIGVILLIYPYNVEAKIEMYEQENIAIEQKVKETVRAYMEYEQNTYDSLLKDADLMTVVIKYPELNSNELVKAEIDLYKENNKHIKILKEEKISKKAMSWWLYFGGRQ